MRFELRPYVALFLSVILLAGHLPRSLAAPPPRTLERAIARQSAASENEIRLLPRGGSLRFATGNLHVVRFQEPEQPPQFEPDQPPQTEQPPGISDAPVQGWSIHWRRLYRASTSKAFVKTYPPLQAVVKPAGAPLREASATSASCSASPSTPKPLTFMPLAGGFGPEYPRLPSGADLHPGRRGVFHGRAGRTWTR